MFLDPGARLPAPGTPIAQAQPNTHFDINVLSGVRATAPNQNAVMTSGWHDYSSAPGVQALDIKASRTDEVRAAFSVFQPNSAVKAEIKAIVRSGVGCKQVVARVYLDLQGVGEIDLGDLHWLHIIPDPALASNGQVPFVADSTSTTLGSVAATTWRDLQSDLAPAVSKALEKGDIDLKVGAQEFNIDPADFVDREHLLPVELRGPSPVGDWNGYRVRRFRGGWLEQAWRPHEEPPVNPDGVNCLTKGDHLHQGAYVAPGSSLWRNHDRAGYNDDGMGFDPGGLRYSAPRQTFCSDTWLFKIYPVWAASAPRTTPVEPCAAPDNEPRNLTANPGNKELALAWTVPTLVPGEDHAVDGYQVRWRKTAPGAGAWSAWDDPSSGTSRTVGGLTNGNSYAVQVRAVNGSGVGPPATIRGTPSAIAPAPRCTVVVVEPGPGPSPPHSITLTLLKLRSTALADLCISTAEKAAAVTFNVTTGASGAAGSSGRSETALTPRVSFGSQRLTAMPVADQPGTWSVTIAANASYLTEGDHDLLVEALNGTTVVSSERTTITVDLTAPTVSYSTPPTSLTVNTAITDIVPTTSDEDIASYALKTGSTLPLGLGLNTISTSDNHGVISGTPSVATAARTVTIVVTDRAGNASEVTLSLPAVTDSTTPPPPPPPPPPTCTSTWTSSVTTLNSYTGEQLDFIDEDYSSRAAAEARRLSEVALFEGVGVQVVISSVYCGSDPPVTPSPAIRELSLLVDPRSCGWITWKVEFGSRFRSETRAADAKTRNVRTAYFVHGNSARLTAPAGSASCIFAGWSGNCSGTDRTCTVTMDRNRSATASYEPPSSGTFIVTGTGPSQAEAEADATAQAAAEAARLGADRHSRTHIIFQTTTGVVSYASTATVSWTLSGTASEGAGPFATEAAAEAAAILSAHAAVPPDATATGTSVVTEYIDIGNPDVDGWWAQADVTWTSSGVVSASGAGPTAAEAEADALANVTLPSGASVTGTTYATEGVMGTIHTAMAAYRWERDSDD